MVSSKIECYNLKISYVIKMASTKKTSKEHIQKIMRKNESMPPPHTHTHTHTHTHINETQRKEVGRKGGKL